MGLNHLPSGRFAANAAWLAVQVMAHNLARWTARLGLGEQIVTTKTLRRRFFSLAGRLTRSARRLTLHLPRRWPWESSAAPARLQAIPFPTVPPARPINRTTVPANSASPVRDGYCKLSRRSRPTPPPWSAIGAPNDNCRPPPAPFVGIEPGPSRSHAPHPLFQRQGPLASVDSGLGNL